MSSTDPRDFNGLSNQKISSTYPRDFNRLLKNNIPINSLYFSLLFPKVTFVLLSKTAHTIKGSSHCQIQTDCIGAIDGTHIPAMVPGNDTTSYRDRHGMISQNVLASCNFDLEFIYVLSGWEGSAHDSLVLTDALHRNNGLKVPQVGYFPASKSGEEVLSAYGMVERQQMRKLLFYYLTICSHSKFKASVISPEATQVQRGIVDLVSKYGIRRLVMGAEPESCMKVNGGCSKTSYVAKHANQFCEIWFVDRGDHACKRIAIF